MHRAKHAHLALPRTEITNHKTRIRNHESQLCTKYNKLDTPSNALFNNSLFGSLLNLTSVVVFIRVEQIIHVLQIYFIVFFFGEEKRNNGKIQITEEIF